MSEEKKHGEWRVERHEQSGLYVCALVSKEGDSTVAHTTVGPFRPDLKGADVSLIAQLCARFGFNVASLADECRRADSLAMATAERERLNKGSVDAPQEDAK